MPSRRGRAPPTILTCNNPSLLWDAVRGLLMLRQQVRV